MQRVATIADTLRAVFALAEQHGIPTGAAADRLAEERIAAAQPS
jgi:hypothetical protein